jgi:hyaluronan synthase
VTKSVVAPIHKIMSLYLRVYGILAIANILMHIVLGHAHHLRRRPRTAVANLPSASVIVPVYNEDPTLLEQCFESLARQDHPAMHVIVVDDGSPNLVDLEPVYAKYSQRSGWTVLRLTTNVGKRCAQRVGFDASTTDVVVTVDSDTTLDGTDSLAMLTRSFLRRKVAAVTGVVAVTNSSDNLLTRLTALRYWMAFHQERAAQSLFGVMLCCSGPFAAYRRSVVMDVLDDYVGQRFLGQRCTFGDDRHLTNLVLSRGHQAIFDPDAHCHTNVPNTWSGFLRQQVRWNKSFYRELLWSLRFAHRRHPYLAVDLLLQTVLPFMLVGALVTVGLRAASDPKIGLVYAGIVLGIAVLRSSYGALRTRSPRFLLFAAYGFIHVGLLIPARLHAIATMGRTHWGTRGMSRASTPADTQPATVLQAKPAMPLPTQRTHTSTVMTVEDTRAARTTIEPGVEPMPRDVLPALERGFNGRWRPVRSVQSTVVMVPLPRTSSSSDAAIDWTLWSLEVSA